MPKAYIIGLTGDPDVAELSDFDAFGLAPTGTGPYRITQFQSGETTVYERFEDYYGDVAPLAGFEMRRIWEMATRLTAVANREVDIITNAPPDQIATIDSNPNLQLVGSVPPLFHVVMFNTGGGAFDPHLPAIWRTYMPDLGPSNTIPSARGGLLDEAGNVGTPIRYDTDPVYYTNGLLAAQAIKEMWATVGVEMQLNVIEGWGELSEVESRNWSNPMYFADPAGSSGTMWAPGGARIPTKPMTSSGAASAIPPTSPTVMPPMSRSWTM